MTTTMNAPSSNGRRRPSLGEQVNRLDNMLDGLSDALNEAVADAVKASVGIAVKEAVQLVLTEVLANPEIRARLTPPAATVVKTQRSSNLWRRVDACIGYLRTACADLKQSVKESITQVCRGAREQCDTIWAILAMLWPFKFQILSALVIGVSVGVGVSYAEPWLAAVTTGIGGFLTSLTVQAGLWLRNVFDGNIRRIS